ncbi:chromosome partitioning protein ParA [Vibrio splendidus]|uniref:chromosome partitioning protein ParA n=1 Tax=Vibrio splendidus TaxID=29497 RepID=UPI000C840A84|nr:chromosome partitioning protein ParA [Vibrio splendidus]PMI77849.1 chromosome partitioning protein ParA [Vibrio splendidus]PMK51219.1 chromosome partitioning protein ParA [Vibrio splendidus]
MNQQSGQSEQDEVVVIEERDKRSQLYIGIAAVIGLALGGLIGSTITASKWGSTYQVLETRYQELHDSKTLLMTSVETKVAKVDTEIDAKVEAALVKQTEVHQKELQDLAKQSSVLEKANYSLEQQLNEQKQTLEQTQQDNQKLNRQADMQSTLFERSREVFRKELQISQELEKLEKEKDELEQNLGALKKACDIFLDGTSWDAKSDACEKQDNANSRLSDVRQMIEVHTMDLKQIKTLTEEMGL